MISNEGHDSVIRDECNAAQLSTLPKPNEMPIALFFALIVVAPSEAEVWIASRFRKPKELRAGMRRSIRAFASRLLGGVTGFHNDRKIPVAMCGLVGRRSAEFVSLYRDSGS